MVAQPSDNGRFTLLTVFVAEPHEQGRLSARLLAVLLREASFDPAFVSASVRRSPCGLKIVTEAQWESRAAFVARSPGFRAIESTAPAPTRSRVKMERHTAPPFAIPFHGTSQAQSRPGHHAGGV